MPSARFHGPALTLANMRAQGVHWLGVVCDLCDREAVINVDRFWDDVPARAFGLRMVCTSCGIVGAFARPNWQRATQESLFYPVTMADDCRYPRATV